MLRLVSLLGLFSVVAMASENAPELVDIELEKSFAAVGFDDNDVTQISVQGNLAGSCEKLGPATYSVDATRKTITISQKAYHYKGACLNIPTTITTTVDVGVLEAGPYKVIDARTTREIGKVEIKESTRQEADDHFYAPVADAYVTQDATLGRVLVLSIAISDTCTKFVSKPDIKYFPGTIVVLPIADRSSEDCKAAPTVKTEKRYAIPSGLTGELLLHVRSRDGKAVNKVVSLD